MLVVSLTLLHAERGHRRWLQGWGLHSASGVRHCCCCRWDRLGAACSCSAELQAAHLSCLHDVFVFVCEDCENRRQQLQNGHSSSRDLKCYNHVRAGTRLSEHTTLSKYVKTVMVCNWSLQVLQRMSQRNRRPRHARKQESSRTHAQQSPI